MGICYVNNKDDNIYFDVNFSGAKILAKIYALAGIKLTMLDRIPYSADGDSLPDIIAKLKKIMPLETHKIENYNHLSIMSQETFDMFCQDFISFLAKCKIEGYKSE